MPGSAPPLYVAIICHNGWKNTIECLETLLRSDYPDVRVFVLDNGSTDGSIEQIKAWAAGGVPAPAPQGALAALAPAPVPKPIAVTCRSVASLGVTGEALGVTGEALAMTAIETARITLVDCEANLGFAGANNVALRYVLRAEPDAKVLLLNDDTVVAAGALSAMAALATDSTAVGATLLQYNAPERVETLGGATVSMRNAMSRLIGWNAPRSAERPAVEMDFISGCCMMMTRNVLERVGLLDERFFIYSEDSDWGVRARNAGVSLTYAPLAEVWHKGSTTMVARSPFQDYHTTRSSLHFIRKHRRDALRSFWLLYIVARLALPKIARRQWQRLRAVRRALESFRSHAPASAGNWS
jgi:GT2 family glycosyltransferase